MKTDPDSVTGSSDTDGSSAEVAENVAASSTPKTEDAKADAAAPAESPADDADPVEAETAEPKAAKAEAEEADELAASGDAVTASGDQPAASSGDEPDGTVSPGPDDTDTDEPTDTAGLAPAGEGPAKKPGFLADLVPPRTTKARVLVAVVLVALIGLGWGGYKWFTTLPDGVAFRVDGADVTEQQLEEQVQTLSALYGVQPPGPEDPAKLDAFRKDVAKSTAVSMAVDNAARERKIVVADRQVQDFLTKYITATYGEGQAGRDAFVKDLAEKNTSEPKVLNEIKRQMTLKQLFGQVTADVTVTDEDVRQAFDTRKAEFATPERREIHNIVVKTRPEADALINEIKGGANFEALATQRSLDEMTKANGGNLGLVSARELQKDYSDAAFAAPVGGLIGPVETQQKSGPMYNVGKVVQSQPSVPAEFDKIKDGVRRLLFAERTDAKWRAFMEEQIKKADIKYAAKYQPVDPDGLPPISNDPSAPGAGGAAPAPPK